MYSWKYKREAKALAVYNLHEITDSKLMYDRRPPRFMLYIIIIVVALIGAFLVWATKSVKTYVVKGQGVVTTENKAYVMAKVSGEITEVFVEEGKEVKEGDVLVTLNAVESNLQLEQVVSQMELLDKRIELLTRAENDASKNTNTFDKNKAEELEFYNRLNNSYLKRKEYEIDEEYLKKQGYTDEQISDFKKQSKNKLNQMYYETILGFTNEKYQLQLEKEKLETQKVALEKGTQEYKIIAPKSGIIHLNTTLNKGMVLQGGSLLGSITNNEENLIVETMLPSVERPRIHINDEVAIAVGGLNQAEYGTIEGKVVSIDEDATIDNENGNIYFKVKIQPKETYLADKKGEKINLIVGMVTETRVKYEKITYMKYFLEQIGIKLS